MATNTQILEVLARIEAKMDVTIMVSGLPSREEVDQLKKDISEIKEIVQVKK